MCICLLVGFVLCSTTTAHIVIMKCEHVGVDPRIIHHPVHLKGLGLLQPVMGNIIASAYQDILVVGFQFVPGVGGN